MIENNYKAKKYEFGSEITLRNDNGGKCFGALNYVIISCLERDQT